MSVIAHHLIFTGYGHWLPNDPRGSMSKGIWSPDLAALAARHFGRREIQPPRPELRAFYAEAQKHLAHPMLWFDGPERAALVEAFGEVAVAEGLTCYACAVLRNHAHVLIRRHRMKAEQMSARFKDAGRQKLLASGFAPPAHPVFSGDSCHIYKSDPPAVRACAAYIRVNYHKHKLEPIECGFVTEYDDWPYHKHKRGDW